MTGTEYWVALAYLAAATLFAAGLHQVRTPATARRGRLVAAGGTLAAVGATVSAALLSPSSSGSAWGWAGLALGIVAVALAGLVVVGRRLSAAP